MIQRTLSTIVIWLLVVASVIIFGPQAGVWLLGILTILTQYELYTLLEKADFDPQKKLGCFLGLLIILGAWYLPKFSQIHFMDAGGDIFAVSVIVISLTVLIKPDFTEKRTRIMPTLFGLLLVPFMLHFYVLLVYHFDKLGLPNTGLFLALWIVAVAKFTDVGGLLIGSLLGKHKLAAAISPGKTWEGAIGGIVTASIVGGVMAFIMIRYLVMPVGFTTIYGMLIAIPIALIAIASDLIESFIKRMAKVKDSGKMIPGIGGAFDLTDSLLLTAPCAFLIIKYTLF